ncbi:MAG: hypothetical protein WA883_11470 [Phormidesmis sp.]
MATSTVVFIFGAVLLALGLLGEGVSIKDISIPKISKISRFIFILLGSLFIIMGIGLGASELSENNSSPTVIEPAPTISPAETSPEPIEPAPTPPTPTPQPAPTATQPVEPSSPEASDDEAFREQITAQMMTTSQWAVEQGYTFVASSVDKIDRNQTQDIDLSLEANVSYTVTGVCDSDCRDIDLELYDDNNNLISSDVQTDDFPIVSVTPVRSASFTLRVGMPNCGADYCYYGATLFRQQG